VNIHEQRMQPDKMDGRPPNSYTTSHNPYADEIMDMASIEQGLPSDKMGGCQFLKDLSLLLCLCVCDHEFGGHVNIHEKEKYG
jgi:hypothetical protein